MAKVLNYFEQVDGQRIAICDSAGRGHPIVFLHGNSCSSRAFARQFASALGAQFRLIAIDLPGHGRSDDARDPMEQYALRGYAALLVTAAHQIGVDDAIFVGWSLGGHIVLEASQSLPRARGLGIFGTPPLSYPPQLAEAFHANPALNLAFQERWTADECALFARSLLAPDTTAPTPFADDLQRADGRARMYIGASIQAGAYSDEVKIVDEIDKPLLIVHGEQDQLVKNQYIDKLRIPRLWGRQVHIVSGAGHAPQWEACEVFNRLLSQFASELASIR